MIMHQNCIFATPSTPRPGQPKPNPAYLDQLGGCCKRFWGQVGEVWPSWCRIWVLKTAISLYLYGVQSCCQFQVKWLGSTPK